MLFVVLAFALVACDSPAPTPAPTATSTALPRPPMPATATPLPLPTATSVTLSSGPTLLPATTAPTPLPSATSVALLPSPTVPPPTIQPQLATPTAPPTIAPKPSPSPTQTAITPSSALGPRSARHSGKLFMASKDDGWYVKDNALYRWDGKHWQAVAGAAPGATFASLSYISDSSIWLAGSALAHWDGAAIKIVASSDVVSYTGVSALADDDVWLSGNQPVTNTLPVGIIQHWDGSKLQSYATPSSVNSFNAIAMINHADGWAIGGRTTMRYDGTGWKVVASHTGDPLLAIDMLSASDGWAVGRYANIIHWSGSRWDKVAGPWPPYTELVGISMVSADDGWLIGFVNGDNRGGIGSGGELSLPRIMHWDGKQWLDVDASGANPFMDSISMVSHNDGWILVPALHWDGSEWQTHGKALQTPNPFPSLP